MRWAHSRRTVACSLMAALCWTSSLDAATNSWNKIRFMGGSIQPKVDAYDWNTTLTVGPDAIVLAFEHNQKLRIQIGQVTALSYGQEAHRRVGEMVALSVMVTPVALFGLLHKGKDHFIAIQYQAEDGKPASILLEAHKDNYKAVLEALKSATGKPVANAP